MPNPASAGLPNPAAYSKNADGTVTDNVTGLTWEGTVDSGSYAQGAAATYCANKAPAGGWRLPTRLELVSLVDFTVPYPGPTIDQTNFPNTPAALYWASSADVGFSGYAWGVDFNFGTTFYNAVTPAFTFRVRCLRMPAPKDCPTRYVVQGGGLVSDTATGLTWQQTVDAGSYTWSAAMTHCAGLGTGWRLPSLTELQTIVDDTKVSPAIDGAVFPNTPAKDFWTSSVYAQIPTEAWVDNFDSGDTFDVSVTTPNRVRCVR
jgi:hypothetical protein